MKLIHTSDLHLDSPLTSRLSKIHSKERKKELIQSFRRIVENAALDGVEAIIIAGDLFDNDSVGIRTLNYVMSIIEKTGDITFLYLSGNHEKSRIIDSGIQIPDNLKVFGEDWTYFKFKNVTVAGRSTIDEKMFDTISLSDNERNIVVLHGILAEHTDNTEKIGISEIEKLPVDYLALGHYHSYSAKEFGCRGVAVYCGTPEGRGFDEAGEKGYVMLNVEDGGITHRFIPSAERRIHIVDVNLTEKDSNMDVEDKVANAISDIPSSDIIRIILSGKHRPGDKIDPSQLERRFAEKYYYLEIKCETKLAVSIDEYKNDKSLKGEFIRLVMSKNELTDEEKSAIIECGIKALAGEEL